MIGYFWKNDKQATKEAIPPSNDENEALKMQNNALVKELNQTKEELNNLQMDNKSQTQEISSLTQDLELCNNKVNEKSAVLQASMEQVQAEPKLVFDKEKAKKAFGKKYQLHDPKTWPQQAQLAFEGKWNELKKLQDKLDGGK